jgi:hypothetical protein
VTTDLEWARRRAEELAVDGVLIRAEEAGAFDAAFEEFVDGIQHRYGLEEGRRRYYETVSEAASSIVDFAVDGSAFAKHFRSIWGRSPGGSHGRTR